MKSLREELKSSVKIDVAMKLHWRSLMNYDKLIDYLFLEGYIRAKQPVKFIGSYEKVQLSYLYK